MFPEESSFTSPGSPYATFRPGPLETKKPPSLVAIDEPKILKIVYILCQSSLPLESIFISKPFGSAL